MKKFIATALTLAAFLPLMGQKVWTEPAQVTNPADSVKIYIDLTQMDCDKLVGFAGPIYIWTWMPGDPVNGNGAWNASNTDNAWVNEGPDIWSFTILPVDFYGVTAQDVYASDIHFLAKALDGGSGGDCSAAGDEWKTEDLTVEVNPPGPVVRKVYSFPNPSDGDSILISQNDIFSLIYDNSQEEKVSMQNPGDLYVYARAYDLNGTEYRPATISQVRNHPELKMTQEGSIYRWPIWPAQLFNLPAGQTLDYVRLQIMKPNLVTSDDAVDGLFEYFFRCN